MFSWFRLDVGCGHAAQAAGIPKDRQLGQAYFERCIPVVEKRLATAGVRLAELLNGVFADGPEPIPLSGTPKAVTSQFPGP